MTFILSMYGFVLGGAVSSYAGVVADRGLRRSTDGRSRCACGSQLRVRHLLPIVSWLSSLGVATCCGNRIPARYVFTEIGGAVTVMTAAVAFGPAGFAASVPVIPAVIAANRWLADDA